ncbi:MAG TPA: lytic transglycosylase domain-containing protein [Phenylobacterium sp.]|nr:lytic transglycosylase domain-containing protein [Phenylobacterium sp.]
MNRKARKALLAVTMTAALVSVADAQPTRDSAPPQVRTPQTAYYQPLSEMDATQLRAALAAARRGDVSNARAAMTSISDPIARKIALWALVDASGQNLSFFEVQTARNDLAGWPRASRRQAHAERLLETSGQSPQQTIAFFGGAEPETAEGAMALASALQATGKGQEATALIRRWWRDKLFESDVQRRMLARFGGDLTQDDHVRRLDILLYGSQGPATRDMLGLVPADQRQLAEARMAFRSNSADANTLATNLPANLANHPGLAFERAAYLRRRNMSELALGMVRNFPTEVPHDEAAERIWGERYQLILAALRNRDYRGAYNAAANSGLTKGVQGADAEFYAGWLALVRLRDPAQADRHFANLERIGRSPITEGRALYWRGRAAEAAGDKVGAAAFYGRAAQHGTVFYGQLALEKIGQPLKLGRDPEITTADRARFDGREAVRAARILNSIGEDDAFNAFVLALDDVLPTLEEQALLVDLARSYGSQDLSMKVVRAAAQRGFILPERGYPMRTPPQVFGAPEPALTLGITRQESGFDPRVRSGAGARGMMQLMPATASIVARKIGVGYSADQLYEPDYNMRLGQTYLRDVIDQFSGSYVMGIASYNAGPGRPAQWSAFCGDPRTASVDGIDFIECIPFSETRNYVMRVMEGMQVYRARLNNGTAPVTLTRDLNRGGYTYAPTTPAGT